MSRFTYKEQPNNLEAYRLGEACYRASQDRHGDFIDLGLVLLRHLQEHGYAVIRLPPGYNADRSDEVHRG